MRVNIYDWRVRKLYDARLTCGLNSGRGDGVVLAGIKEDCVRGVFGEFYDHVPDGGAPEMRRQGAIRLGVVIEGALRNVGGHFCSFYTWVW